MGKPTRKDIEKLLKLNRQEALDFAQKAGRGQLLKVLQQAESDLVQRISQSSKLKTSDGDKRFTTAQQEVALAQIRDVIKTIVNPGIKKILLGQVDKVSESAVGLTVDYMQASNKAYLGVAAAPLPIKPVAMLDNVRNGVESSVLRRLASGAGTGPGEPVDPRAQGILQRYGTNTIGMFEAQMQQGLLQGKTWTQMSADLVTQSSFLQGAPASWADRIVRTEIMGSFNRATWESNRELNDALNDVVKILMATFDDRTGWDSYQVHGQIRKPDEAFEWAEGKFHHPPNRPYDREVVVSHRISWPIPDYLEWRSDEEVEARYYQQRKKGSPGPRPDMTTVPLDRFPKS